eukprot:805955-Lingulodinium_polyedra.AAC.1
MRPRRRRARASEGPVQKTSPRSRSGACLRPKVWMGHLEEEEFDLLFEAGPLSRVIDSVIHKGNSTRGARRASQS